MSKYYTPIDINKYKYQDPNDIKSFMDRPLNLQELKEFIPGYDDLKTIASKALDVGKAVVDVGGKKDKDKEKQDKEKKKDYKQYSKFLVNGFRDYEQQYFLHPILYVNEEKRLIGYTVLSDTVNSWLTDEYITLQPYKLQNTDLYKLDKQKNHGKLQTITQKVLGFPYKRCLFKKIRVNNISRSDSPVSGFKMGQQLTLPIYKALNKFNPVRGTKFFCELVYYDESNRQLLIGKEIYIEQVTQNKVILSKIIPATDKKGSKPKIIKRTIDLSLIIPTYATNVKLENPVEGKKESNIFKYSPIFPFTIEDGEQFYKLYEAEKTAKPKLVLFYIRPFLAIEESEKELDSYSADKSTFDFDYPIKNDHSSLRPFLLGKDEYSSRDGGGLDRIDRRKLEAFLIAHRDSLRLHGLDLDMIRRLLSEAVSPLTSKLQSILKQNPSALFNNAYSPYRYEVSFLSSSENEYKFKIKTIVHEELPSFEQSDTIVININDITYFVEDKNVDGKKYNILFINESALSQESSPQETSSSQETEITQETENTQEETQSSSSPIISNLVDDSFTGDPSSLPSQNTTTPESLEQTITDIQSGSGGLTQEEWDVLINSLESGENISQEEIENINTIEDEKEKKKIKLLTILKDMAISKADIDIIEVNEDIDKNSFEQAIVNATSMDQLSQYVYKKYSGRLESFNIDSLTTEVSNLKEIDLSNILSSSSTQETPVSSQESNTSNINPPEGAEITYYKSINTTDLSKSELPTDSRYYFYEVWKQGNNYYVRLNPKNTSFKRFIDTRNIYLDDIFDSEGESFSTATSIKNIKPAVFDATTKQLTQKGEIQLI